MAEQKTTRRRGAKAAEPESPAPEEKPEAAPTEAQAPEQEPEAAPAEEKPADKTMVEVRNLRRLDYVQPSTQIRIRGGETTLMLDDGWLKLQCDANLLERV